MTEREREREKRYNENGNGNGNENPRKQRRREYLMIFHSIHFQIWIFAENAMPSNVYCIIYSRYALYTQRQREGEVQYLFPSIFFSVLHALKSCVLNYHCLLCMHTFYTKPRRHTRTRTRTVKIVVIITINMILINITNTQ